MNKFKKIITVIMDASAICTLLIVMINGLTYMLDTEIIKLKYEWFEIVLHFGNGVLCLGIYNKLIDYE